MYEDVVVEHLPQTHQSKAQSALHKSATQVCADQSATTQASRQSWRTRACRRAFTQLAAFSKRTKKSKSAWQKYTTTHNAAAQAGVTGKNSPLFPISRKYNTTLSLRHFYVFLTCMRRPGCFHGAWSSANPAGPVLSLEVSVVATTRVSRSLFAFRILIRISKICFCDFFFSIFCVELIVAATTVSLRLWLIVDSSRDSKICLSLFFRFSNFFLSWS